MDVHFLFYQQKQIYLWVIGLSQLVYNKINNIKKKIQYIKTFFGHPPYYRKTQHNMTNVHFLAMVLFHYNIARLLVPLFP